MKPGGGPAADEDRDAGLARPGIERECSTGAGLVVVEVEIGDPQLQASLHDRFGGAVVGSGTQDDERCVLDRGAQCPRVEQVEGADSRRSGRQLRHQGVERLGRDVVQLQLPALTVGGCEDEAFDRDAAHLARRSDEDDPSCWAHGRTPKLQ